MRLRTLTRVMSAGVVLLMLFGLIASSATPVSAASDYYKEKGHYLYGQFRDYWNGNGGLARFGFPITKVFNSKSTDGNMYQTQYLERSVFEEHPENKGGAFEVLGRLLGVQFAGARMQTDSNFKAVAKPTDGRLFFDKTGHTIGGSDAGNAAIRAYWEAAGNGNQTKSIVVFGYPISEPFDEQVAAPPAGDGKTHRVQYFERYRLEYYPDNPDPYKVQLGLLGQSQATADNLDPTLLAPEPAGQPQPDCISQNGCSAQPLPKSYAGLHVGDGADGYGFNVDANGLDAGSKETMFGQVSGAGFNWIRQQVRWSSYEPAKAQFGNDYVAQVDALVNATAAKGQKILLSVQNSPGWAGVNGGLPNNPKDMGDLMTFMANRYKGKVQAYEIWNEENYAQETGGQVNIGAYIPILKAGYQALKASDPNITVVFGGQTPTGVTGHPEVALDDVQYLQQIYAINGGEVKNYYDVLGAHPGSNCNPPDNSYPDNPPTNACGTDPDGGRSYTKDNSFYFKRILQIRSVMEQNGESAKKMWLTEFGWDSSSVAVPNYQYAQYVSEDQQAQYLMKAFALGKSYPWMGVMFVWNLNFSYTLQAAKGGDAVNDEKFGWSVLKGDGSPRPSYTALKNMAK